MSPELPPHLRPTDSAGTPWEGRRAAPSPFAGDRGEQPAALAAALGTDDRAERLEALVAALATSRVLVPVTAIAGEHTVTETGLVADNEADMALMRLEAPDGSSVLPVFTSLAELAAWNGEARPQPVTGPQAAQSAVSEGCTGLLVDAAGPGQVVGRAPLWALGQGQVWTPAWRSAALAQRLSELAGGIASVVSARFVAGTRSETKLELAARPGLDQAGVDALARTVQQEIVTWPELADSVSSLEIGLVASR